MTAAKGICRFVVKTIELIIMKICFRQQPDMRSLLLFLVFASCYVGVAQTTQQSDGWHQPQNELVNEENAVGSHELWCEHDTVLIDTACISLQDWLASRGMTEDVTINLDLEELYQKDFLILEYL